MKILAFFAIVAVTAVARLEAANVFNMPGGQKSLEFVPVGDLGNVPDTVVDRFEGTTGYGSVSYAYSIGKYDVTVAQYATFLNAVAKDDPYACYSTTMSALLGTPGAGISRSGAAGNYSYAVAAGHDNYPINDVSWGSAARFANWVQNGQPIGPEGAGTTETGAYGLNGAVSNADLMAVTRSPGALYRLPTDDEWYKAAYYKGSGLNAGYWQYATQSDSKPSNTLSVTGTNNANFYDFPNVIVNGGYTNPVDYLTSVGAFAASPSAYNTFDQAGNVFNWLENVENASSRSERGGAFYYHDDAMMSNYRGGANAVTQTEIEGFRLVSVAAVPEPSSIVLFIGCSAGLGLWAIRRRNACA